MKLLLIFTLILASCTGIDRYSRGPASTPAYDIKSVMNQLLPFTSDGCPQFPYSIEYPRQEKWQLCCLQHDVAYWKGGTSEERSDADKQLRDCIIQQNEPNVAGLVYLGARHSDTEVFSFSKRWGYGWKIHRGYTPHTPDDLSQIEKLQPADIRTLELGKPAKAPSKRSDSLTGNFCLDGVLSFIQHQLHRNITPMRIEHSLVSSGDGFEETFKINDQQFSEPYEFKFYMTKKTACTQPPNAWSKSTRVQLKSFSY